MLDISYLLQIYYSDVFTWNCVVFLTVAISIYFYKYETLSVFCIVLLAWFLRVGLAYYNAHIEPLPFTDKDSIQGFHFTAVAIANDELHIEFIKNGSGFFSVALAKIYSAGTISMFLGSICGSVAYITGLLFFTKILRFYITSEWMLNTLIIIMALLPGSLIYSSTVMREPYILCLLLMAAYFIIKAMHGNAISNFVIASLILIFPPLLHIKAMYPYANMVVILAAMALLFIYSGNIKTCSPYVL